MSKMDEQTLEYIYEKFKGEKRNEYNNISIDLMEVTKKELDNLKIKYNTKKYKGRERLYLYEGDEFLFRYVKSFYPNNSKLSFHIANDKILTEKFLHYSNIQTTNSKVYTAKEYKKALERIKDTNQKQVLKPISLIGGIGVYMNIDNDNFDYAWSECLKIQSNKKIELPRIILQNQIEGFEVRVNITEGNIFSATLRVPSHVIGDGVNNIEHLIKEKNKKRKANNFFKNKLIKIDENLKNILNQKNKSLKDILNKNEYCVLIPQSNIVHGGENYEITNMLQPEILNQARRAVLAIPGLHTAGVDIIIDSFDSVHGTVIEVNKAPEFIMTYYPLYGVPYRPLNYIFNSLMIESKITRNKLLLKDIEENAFEVIKNRYKFLYEKQLTQEESIAKLLEENAKLKEQLNITDY